MSRRAWVVVWLCFVSLSLCRVSPLFPAKQLLEASLQPRNGDAVAPDRAFEVVLWLLKCCGLILREFFRPFFWWA